MIWPFFGHFYFLMKTVSFWPILGKFLQNIQHLMLFLNFVWNVLLNFLWKFNLYLAFFHIWEFDFFRLLYGQIWLFYFLEPGNPVSSPLAQQTCNNFKTELEALWSFNLRSLLWSHRLLQSDLSRSAYKWSLYKIICCYYH